MKKADLTQFQYSCDGPFIFGPAINRVCCHGWNCGHFLTTEEVNRTQRLINAGVIKHESERHPQQVDKLEEEES